MTLLEQDRLPPPTEEPPRGPRRTNYGTVVLGAVMVVAGALWFFDAIGVVDLRLAVVLPAALATIGVALIVGSRDGPHTGLVVVGLVMVGAVLLAAIAPSGPVDGVIGERSFVVATADEVQPAYDVGVGELFIDLSTIRPERAIEVNAEVGAGRLVVELPPDVPVLVEGTVGIGELRLPDQTINGLGLSHTYESDDYAGSGAAITLVADVGVGELEVTR